MLLDGTKYVNFEADAPHLLSLKWNKQRTRPRLTMRDGTQYEITVPGKTVKDLENLTLGDWKKIAEELNRILVDKGILDALVPSPANAHCLDKLLINKEGVTFDGTTYKHVDGTDTKARFKTMRNLSGKAIPSTVTPPSPSAPPAPVPPAPGPGAPVVPGAPAANAQAAMSALKKVGGMQKAVLDKVAAEITADVDNTSARFMNAAGTIQNWEDLAIDLSDSNTKADAIYNDNVADIPDAKKAEVQQKIQAVYAAKAVEIVVNGVVTEATAAIKAQRNWKTGVAQDIVDECYDNVLADKFQPLIDDSQSPLIDPVKNRLKVELTEAKIKSVIRTRLQQLLADEARRPVGQYQGYLNQAKAAGSAVKGAFNWASNLWNGEDD
ncbi:MAG: hypothetical protein Q8K75_07310 [Chlamydiales bacterium]|nr:hypothetical protein [Chlamydiales bacterium]